MKLYIVAYDIADEKRLRKVRKVAYSFAFGGQKSAIESYLTSKMLQSLQKELLKQMNIEQDRINIIEVEKKAILLGKAKQLPFDKGSIIV